MMKPTKTYDIYEVVKVPFPFTDVHASKVRPALVISSAKHFNAKIGMSVMAMITSIKQFPNPWPSDVLIDDIDVAGLPFPSLIRFKLFTLDHRLILDRLGVLGSVDQSQVQNSLRNILLM